MKCAYCDRDDSQCKIKIIKGICYCPKHLTRHYRQTPMDALSIYGPNEYVENDDCAEIILRDKDSCELGRAIIDKDDVEKCKQYKWHMRKGHGDTDYVIASLPDNKKVHLHRFVLNYDGPLDVDHINRNGLDNRKSNLRIVNHSENTSNNKHTGIYHLASGRYRASCCRNYKTHYIGTYDTYEEAQAARTEYINNLTVGQ